MAGEEPPLDHCQVGSSFVIAGGYLLTFFNTEVSSLAAFDIEGDQNKCTPESSQSDGDVGIACLLGF
jgi:hypothetical protein